MQQAAQLPVENQLSPGGPVALQTQLTPDVRDGGLEKPAPQPRPGPPGSQQPVPQRVPRLRAVVESQAFKDILVDEMDLMHARAATLIQANWRGHRLRQKLVSQMTAAKAIQEAWRRFSTRRLLRRSGKLTARAQVEEGDIPYHPPQQVRFRSQPAVVSQETQAPCAHVLAPRGPPAVQRPAAPGPHAPCTPTAAVLPHQATARRLPCPASLDSECRPGPVPTTGRSPHLVSSHVVLNAAICRYVTSRATKAGALEPPLSGSCSPAVSGPCRTQAHTDAEPLRTPSQTHRVAAPTRTPTQTYPAPAVTRTQPQPCLAPNKAYTQVRPTPSPARPTPPVSRTPPQPSSATMATKTSPQMRLVTAPIRSPLQTTQPATVCKTPPQPGPSSPKTKPQPQMRLAAIITRTPAAHIRSVAAIFKTLCLTLQAPGNPRAPPGKAEQAAGTPSCSPSLHADTPRTRGPANTPQATAGTVKVSDLRCRAEGSIRVAPQPHLETGTRGTPTREPVRTEKTHTGVQKLVNEEMGSKANVATQATRAPSWARLAEERSRPLSQMHQRTEVLKVQSQVYMPVQATVALPRAQVAVPLTKAQALGQPAKVSSQAHLHKAQLAIRPPATSHGHPPTEQTKALSQPHLATCPAKASSRAPPSSRLSKAPSRMHLVTCLTRAQSQAQLVTDATRSVCAAHQTTSRGSKAPSHPLLTGPSAPTSRCQPPGALGSGSHVKPDHRQGDTGPERQGMLVPLLAAAAAKHPSCNVESWGDSKTTQAQLSAPSPAAPSQEDMVASQMAALCAELVTVLGSHEDLRVLLTKALSQGEVRTALNQALSREVLGATVAKVLPQSMLGMVLAKALSWGELGATLSRSLPRAELCAELTKAVQGRLAEVLSRALTQEERAALSRALCQGELGAILSQSLSRAAPRAGAVLPKASSKVTSSKMRLLPAPAWGPGLGFPVWLRSCKVRVRGVGVGGGLAAGALGDRGDGAALEGPPCWPYFPVSAASSSRTPVSSGPDLLLSCLARWSRVCSSPHLSPEIRKETAHPASRAGELVSDANPVVGGGPLQPLPSPWQPFITIGIGPSTSRLSVTHSPAPSAPQPPVVSRVAPRTGTSSGEGSAASGRPSGDTGVGRGIPPGPSSPTGQGAACWCQTVGTKKGTPSLPRPSAGRGLRQPSKAARQNLKKAQPPNPRQGFPTISKVTANAQKAAGDQEGGPMSVSTSTWLGQVCSQSPTRQERSPTQGLASGLASSQEPLVGLPGSPLSGQGACVPSVSAQCTSRGSAPLSPGDRDSQSSPSLSTTSTGSVATVEVLDHTGKGSWDQEPRLEAMLSQEPVGQPQDPRDLEETGGASPRSLSPRLPCLPPKGPKHAPVLRHTLVSSCLALSVHWDTEGEKGQSPVEETERTAQGTLQSGPRTLSLGTEVPALGLQPSVAPKFSCLLSQPSLASRAAPCPGQSSGATGGTPTFTRPAMATALTPSLSQSTVSTRSSLCLGHPSVASGVGPGSHQPSAVCGVNPSLSQPSVAIREPPSLAPLPMASEVSPGPSQPVLSHRMAFRRARPFLAARMCPYLSQPRVASLGSPSLVRRPVVWRGGHSFPEPPSMSVGGSGLPGLGIPTTPAQPHPSYPGVGSRPGWGLDQAPLGSSVGPRDNPLTVPSTVPDPQDPELGGLCPDFHQPPGICEGLPTAATVPGPHHCQACVALEEDPGPVWGPGASHQTWFRGMTASAPQGHVAPGAFLSLFPGGPRGGLAGVTSWPHMDASVCQCPGADGTAAVASQVLETAAPVLLRGPSGTSGVGQGLSPAVVPQRHRMNKAQLSPGDLDPSVCLASVPVPVILYHQPLGMATGVPSSYQHSGGVTQTPGMGVAGSGLVPGCAGRVTTDTVVPDTSGLAFSLPPGSVITDIGRGLPPGPVMAGAAQGLPPGPGMASRVATRQVAASGPRGKPCLSTGPLARFSAPRLPPGSGTCSLDPQVPLGSMAEGVGCSPLPGSLLVGLSPRPFHRARAGEDPTGPSQGAGATSLAQIHPQALAESQAARGCQVSPALSRASRFGRRMSEAPGGQARWRPGAAWESAPQAPGSCREPGPAELVQGPAWLHPGPPDTGVHCDPGPLFVEGPLPKDSMPPLREAAPSHASRGASVPAWALSSARHPMASDTTPVLQPKSVSSWGPPGFPFEAASWSPGVQAGFVVDGATCWPLAPVASEGHPLFPHKSLALLGVGGCSQGTVASRAASRVPQLAPDSLHPESVARMGNPSLPWRSGAAGVMAQVPARQSWAKPATAALPQGEAAPRAPQKPTPLDWPPSSLAQSPGARRLCKSHQDSLVPALLEGPAAELGPRGPSLDLGLTPEGVAQGRSGPRPSQGHESAPQWPLFDQPLPYLTSPRAHHRKLSLTPGPPQAQLPHYFSGPTVSHCKPSLTPGVPQGPADTGPRGGQPCNSAVPSVAVRPLDRSLAPHDTWQPPRGLGLWGRAGQPGTPDWTVSLQHVERVVIQAAVVIQACARGYLVRRTIRMWHQRATVIQATWRGHHVRRNLARLYRATMVIQAVWRGHRVRQARARHTQLPHAWAEPGREARVAPEHRCFQSCQPRLCSLCRTLSPGLGSPPSVVMLVGSSPRTCHTCGHTLPTRVVCGMGQAGATRTCASRPPPRAPQEPWDAAATTIQSAWKGFKVRRQLRKQQSAARMLQATWRGHYTRSCLTPEALLGTGSPWDSAPGAPRLGARLPSRWPGI